MSTPESFDEIMARKLREKEEERIRAARVAKQHRIAVERKRPEEIAREQKRRSEYEAKKQRLHEAGLQASKLLLDAKVPTGVSVMTIANKRRTVLLPKPVTVTPFGWAFAQRGSFKPSQHFGDGDYRDYNSGYLAKNVNVLSTAGDFFTFKVELGFDESREISTESNELYVVEANILTPVELTDQAWSPHKNANDEEMLDKLAVFIISKMA